MHDDLVESSTELIEYQNGVYRTAPVKVSMFSRMFPTINFYRKFGWNVYSSSVLARRGKYGRSQWSRTSHEVLRAIESVGVHAEIHGIQYVRRLKTPCVFVGNHMSMLETMVLPAIIQPVRDVTFVVKQSLLDYPVFRHIVRTRNPIAVTRTNPREDLKSMMNGGTERLNNGISIVVFPQTTRSSTFDPSQFNSIGIKLALRAKVPVIPIALQTDAWGNGKWFKDFGRIDTGKTVRFEFGEPVLIQGRGEQQHDQIIEFIQQKLNQWNAEESS
ncbi:MAG: 1-acyl-sn-glycerol-3-phosphate acyltransferase [Planctomycetales bacterium]|nr:1-acyl-sn-glycerol-3-phosphate acyltransferase [Planctomycetales bacterium]